MFSTITWEQFTATIIIVAGSYYVISFLLLYHKEIARWVKSPRSVTSFVQPREESKSHDIMGSVSRESVHPRTSTLHAEDIVVGDDREEEPETIKVFKAVSGEKDNLLIGSVADLMQEIKTLIQLVADYKSDQVESESLFRTLLLRYPHVRSTAYRQTVSEYIFESGRNRFPFTVSLEDIYRWWEDAHHVKESINN